MEGICPKCLFTKLVAPRCDFRRVLAYSLVMAGCDWFCVWTCWDLGVVPSVEPVPEMECLHVPRVVCQWD